MKKILTTALFAGLIAGTAFAASNVVSSANIVGYVQVETPAAGSFDLLALTQFSDGTTNNTYDIQTIIANLSDLNSDGLGSSATGADKLYVYNGSGYDKYALFEDSGDGPYWASLSEGGWIPTLEFLGVAASTDTIPRGTACWLETGTGGTSTNAISSGDVLLDETFDVTIGAGFNLMAYPYSSSVNLTNLVITGSVGDGLGSSAAGADKLYVYNGSGYDKYALFDDGVNPAYWASLSEGGWIPTLEFLGVSPADVDINMGGGFWYETPIEKTITFNKIYTIN